MRSILVGLVALIWAVGAHAQALTSPSPPQYNPGNNSLSQTLDGGLRVNTMAQAYTKAPTVTAAAYASGDCIGGLITLPYAPRSGVVLGVTAIWAGGATPALDVLFFTQLPDISTITDHTALSVASADLPGYVGTLSVTGYSDLGTPQAGQSNQMPLPYKIASGTTLYAVVVTRAAVTPTSTSSFLLQVGLGQ